MIDTHAATPDPVDDMLLSAAMEAGAEFIVTHDNTLLEQQSYRGVRFVSPGEFIALLQKHE